MQKKHQTSTNGVKQYVHDDKRRANNPPVGLVTVESDHLNGKRIYKFDPHLDPQLQWAGKAEGISFDVDTVSLHVHQRIDPLTILEVVRKKELQEQQTLFRYFESPENNPPIREAIEFYKHSLGWSNRLIAGDSLLVMNSLLEKERLAEKVQMIYIDPPYGIKYGSNFQPFVNKRDVKDQKDEDLTQEPEMIRAFRDAWELDIHSYLTYLRNNLLVARELLSESGSVFVQISDKNLHLVRSLLDEVFGIDNFVSLISFEKTTSFETKTLPSISDYLIWYGKGKTNLKYHQLYGEKSIGGEKATKYDWVELHDGKYRKLTDEELEKEELIPMGSRVFALGDLRSPGFTKTGSYEFEFKGTLHKPSLNTHWKTTKEGMEKLREKNRIILAGNTLMYKRYLDDFPVYELSNHWSDVRPSFQQNKIYVVQTVDKVIERCILMATDPGDLVFDPTCGSGTTAYCAEKWGRRWVSCDTSRVALTLAKQRLMTSVFDYYELAHPEDGISGGFNYNKIQHITLGSIANNEPPQLEILYDHPTIDKSKKRVTGPFTVESVPSQRVRSFEEVENTKQEADISVARSGETIRQNDWIDEMLATGIRGKGGQKIEFVRVESLPATRWIHAEAETIDGQRVVISFGPEYAPLEQRQVQLAVQETESLVPRPKMVIFASFQFDPEAAKDIDELNWPGVNVLKVQMNTDLLTPDLKKKRASNQSFWLIGQPDVEIKKQDEKNVVVVNGFDYYNTKTGEIESGDVSKIAIWELDTDYDGRSLYPRQIFFPMAGKNEGWSKLAKNLKAQIDETLIEKFSGSVSLPFKWGDNKQIAVKIIDDRGIESLKIIRLKE